VRASDLAGNTSHSQADEIKIDSLAPTLTISESGTGGANGWYISPAQVSASAQDGGSGLAALEVSHNGAAWTPYAAPITLPDGTHSLSFWAEDMAGWVTQETRQIRVDTQPPTISGQISGTSGTNNWYTSTVTVTALASDPEPGSGIETFTYALNSAPAQAYTTPLTLTDGQHNLTLTARDRAGLESVETLTIWVDTVPPALQITSQYPEWVKDSLSLAGTASDGGSGLQRVEVTFDNGQSWHSLGSAGDWSITRDTRQAASGAQTWYARAIDKAGLSSLRSLNVQVDNQAPRIDLPESWNLWDTVTFNARDADSGLADAELVISDPQNRWPKRVYAYQPGHLPHQFKWDRRFGDGTLAPLGDYQVKASAVDRMGNVQIVYATLRISLGETILIPPTATPLGSPLPTATPTSTPPLTPDALYLTPETFSPDASQPIPFGATPHLIPDTSPPDTSPLAPPRETPAESPFTTWLGSLFTPPASATIPPLAEPDGINWGAGALAAAAGMSAYYLSKRREEEEAQRRAVREQVAAKNDALRAKEAQMREQAKIQNYLQGKAMLEAALADSGLSDDEKKAIEELAESNGMAAGLGLTAATVDAISAAASGKKILASPAPNISMPPGLPPEAQQAFLHGGAAAQQWINNNAAQLQAEQQAKLEKQQRDAQAKDTAASYSSQAAAWLGIDKYIYKPKAPKETAAQEKPWWETAGEWWQDNVVSPVQETIQKTIVEPAQQAWNALTTPASVWLGGSPNYEGIKIAERIVPNEGTITIMGGYGPIVVENFLVRPGISIQAQWYNEMIDSRDGWSKDGGLGYAQVSDKQVKGEILDAEEKYTGNLGLGPNFDQTTDKGAYIAMATRIGIALEACARYCNLTNSQEYDVWVNRLLFSALSQNGSGYSPRYFNARQLPKVNSDIDWVEFLKDVNAPSAPDARIRELLTGKKYEPDFMVEMYVRDLQQMHTNGMPVPEEYLKALERVLEKLEEAKNNRSETNE
jgi:hypothetical protein